MGDHERQRVISIDLVANAEADHNVTLQINDAWATQAEKVRGMAPNSQSYIVG